MNQVTQCDSEPQAIETTNLIAKLYSTARATTLIGYKFAATFSEKKVPIKATLKDYYISALKTVRTN